MSKRNNGASYESHQRAAELHDQAAHRHGSVAESHDEQDHVSGHERSRQALEHTHKAHVQAGKAHPATTLQHDDGVLGDEDTATLAHKLWQARGCPEGSPHEDWFQASALLQSSLSK